MAKTKKKKKAPSPAFAFLLKELGKDKKASFASIKAKAEKKGLKIYPVSYGRAQLALGIVKRGKGVIASKKKAAATKRAKAKAAPSAKRRGRSAATDFSALESILASVREVQGQNEALVGALQDIRGILDDVLAT